MNRTRRSFVLFVLVALVGLIAGGVTSRAGRAQTATPGPMGQGFVGTWEVAQIIAGKPAGVRLATWFSDGTILTTGPVVTPAASGAPNKLVYNSTAHGEWYATGPDTATATFSWMRSDENGTLLGMTTVHLNSTLGADGQTFHNVVTVVLTDADGKVIATLPGAGDGTRLKAVPPDVSVTGTPAA